MMDDKFFIIGSCAIVLIIGFYFFSQTENDFFSTIGGGQRFFSSTDEKKTDTNRFFTENDYRNTICLDGYFVYGITPEDRILCAPESLQSFLDTNVFISGVSDCPANQCIYGFNFNGTIDCRDCSAGSGGVSDGNVYSLGIMSKDTNAFLIDLNMNGKNIGKVNDMNTLDLNVGRNLNVGRVWKSVV